MFQLKSLASKLESLNLYVLGEPLIAEIVHVEDLEGDCVDDSVLSYQKVCWLENVVKVFLVLVLAPFKKLPVFDSRVALVGLIDLQTVIVQVVSDNEAP